MSNFANCTFTNGSYTGALTGYTPGGSDVGGAWLVPTVNRWTSSVYTVDSSGRIYPSTLNSSYAVGVNYSPATPPAADYSVEADFYCLTNAGKCGLIARTGVSAVAGYILAYSQFTGWTLSVVNANGGAGTALGTPTGAATSAMTVGQTIHAKITVQGATITATLSGSGFNGGTPITWSGNDSTYTAAGYAGVWAAVAETGTTGIRVTNFQASARPTPWPAPAAPPRSPRTTPRTSR